MATPRFLIILGFAPGGAELLRNFLSREGLQNVRVVVNDSAVQADLQAAGLDARLVTDYVRIDSAEEVEAFDRAWRLTNRLRAQLGTVRFREVELFQHLKHHVVTNLAFVLQVETILGALQQSGSQAIVLVLPHYNYEYLCLLDRARSLGYAADGQDLRAYREGRLEELRGQVVETDLTPVLSGSASAQEIRERRLEQRRLRKKLAVSATLSALHRRSRHDFQSLVMQYPYEAFVSVELRRLRRAARIACIFLLRTNEYNLYLGPVTPVARRLREIGRGLLMVTDDVRVLQAGGLDAPTLDLTHWMDIAASASLRLEELHEVVRTFFMRIEALAAEARRRSPQSLEAQFLPHLRHQGFYRLALQAGLAIDVLTDVLAAVRPRSVFIMPDSTPLASLMCSIAAQRHIRTVTTLAASVEPSYRSMGVYESAVIAVDGEASARAFRGAGVEEARIVMVGSVALDGERSTSPEWDRRYVHGKIGLDGGKHVVLVATSRADPQEAVWMERLARAASARGDAAIVVKTHPLFSPASYEHLAEACRDLPLKVVLDIDLLPLIRVAEAVVTDHSHVGKVAVILGKPVVTMNLTGVPYRANRFDEQGVALGVYALDEVELALHRILDDEMLLQRLAERRREVVPEYNYRNDGKATDRMVRLLLK